MPDLSERFLEAALDRYKADKAEAIASIHLVVHNPVGIGDHSDIYKQINRLHSIDRVQSISYDIEVPHTDINQLNKRELVDRPIINHPTVNLSFDYLLCGTKNEARLGFDVNYPLFNYPFDGQPYI